MRSTKKLLALSLALPLALVSSATAADFSPTMQFGLSTTKVKANPELTIDVEQDADEEELDHVTLRVPKGFKLPKDEAIDNGDLLGSADLTIAAGPGCGSDVPGTATASIPDRQIKEQDRTDQQADSGVVAVWVVDLQPVTSIVLEVTGSPKKGYTLAGNIPANQWTCPPLAFNGVIFDKTTTGQVPILINPKKPGTYTFSGSFKSQESPTTRTIKQKVKITR
jgi:hypothetical protein